MAHEPSRPTSARFRSRWALLASAGLHLVILANPVLPRRPTGAEEARVDFWAGTTFEPSEVADPGASAIGSRGGEPARTPIEVEATWSEPAPGPQRPSEALAEKPPTRAVKGELVRSHPARGAPTHPASGAPSRASANGPTEAARAGGGTFGGEGAAAGTRDLLRSFLRALPTVASSDAVWSTLPLGHAGSMELTIDVDANSKPHLAEGPSATAPAHLRSLIHKTMVVLSSGRFAPTDNASTRAARVRIDVSLTQLGAPSDSERAAGGVFGMGFDGGDAHQVSRAFFTLASGRHVELIVTPLGR